MTTSNSGNWVLRTIFSVMLMAIVAIAGTLFVVARYLPDLPNIFETEVVEDPHPAVLKGIQDLAELHSVTGDYQVIVELDEDAKFLPDFVKGEETSMLAVGTIDGVIDLNEITDSDVIVIDPMTVTVKVPAARLSDPIIDHEQTQILDRDRGLFDRVAGAFEDNPTSERELLILAEEKLVAAANESGLLPRAEENTERTLRSLLGQLGYTDITITFEPAPN